MYEGAVMQTFGAGANEIQRDIIARRGLALPLFRPFAEVSRARKVEAQSNDILLTLMLYDCVEKIESHVVLFHDALTTLYPDGRRINRVIRLYYAPLRRCLSMGK